MPIIIQRTSDLDIKCVLEKYQIFLNIGFQIVDSILKYFDLNTPHVNVANCGTPLTKDALHHG